MPTTVPAGLFSITLLPDSTGADGASFTLLEITSMDCVATATPSSTVSVKLTVSLAPTATRLSLGSNTSWRMAACAAAAVPAKL